MEHLSIENAIRSIAVIKAGMTGIPSFDHWRYYAVWQWEQLIAELSAVDCVTVGGENV